MEIKESRKKNTRARLAKFVMYALAASFLFLTVMMLLVFNFWPEEFVKYFPLSGGRSYYGQAIPHHLAQDLAHIIIHGLLGIILVLTGAIQMSDQFRKRFRQLHKVIGSVYLAVGSICAGYGFYLANGVFGGWYTRSAVFAVGAFWFVTAFMGAKQIYFRKYKLHGRWMARNYFATLSTFFVRPFYLILYPIFPEVSVEILFPISFWATFVTTIFLSEWYLYSTEKQHG